MVLDKKRFLKIKNVSKNGVDKLVNQHDQLDIEQPYVLLYTGCAMNRLMKNINYFKRMLILLNYLQYLFM